MTHVHTANLRWAGPGRFDTTRRAEHPLAPSASLVADALEMRAEGTPAMCLPTPGLLARYKGELRTAWRARRLDVVGFVKDLWEHGEPVLVCYCTLAEHCHRTVLADFVVAVAPSVGVSIARGRELVVTYGHVTMSRRKNGRRCIPMNISESAQGQHLFAWEDSR